MDNYADIIIEYPVKSLDKMFTYKIPLEFQKIIKIGMKVIIPFGNKKLNGIVVKLHNSKPNFDTKEIIDITNREICLNEEQMSIADFLVNETLCTKISAYQTMLPSSLKIKTQKNNYDLYDIYIRLSNDSNKINKYINDHSRAIKQIEVINLLKKEDKLPKIAFNSNIINILKKENIIEYIYIKKNRININNTLEEKFKLNEEQQEVYDKVKNNLNKYNTYLLLGVTGSGKTEVYMHLIEDVIKNGKTAIVLVPEICLTTQAVKRFYNRFGSNVAVFHSGLSEGEKYDEYLKIYNNEVKIVVGTRSSIFAPLKNIGIIIIDEEQSDTYHQENNPRYDAKKVAEFRCKNLNIPLLLSSATPSLESMARASKGIYTLLKLTKRAGNSNLPNIINIDMNKEAYKGNYIFSDQLKEKIQEKLDKKEQIILLLNRRGYSTFISCKNCGYTYKCPNCDITLTYHKNSNNLRCHYCDYHQKLDDICPKCHEKSLNYLGLGTEKLESELLKLFSNAKVIRMDQDTTTKKGSYQKILDSFENHEYDILLGTQMISKGLDFNNVTLVGVINADTSLNIPDFRANERTFSLLYQTSGRSGRRKEKGDVLIQTYNPDNKVFKYIANNDYIGFFNYEMDIRHKLKYPPYTYITTILVKSNDYNIALKESNNIRNILLNNLDKSTIIYEVTQASIFKINNIYHYQIIIKYTHDKNIKNILKKIDNNYILNSKLNVDITFNPSHF